MIIASSNIALTGKRQYEKKTSLHQSMYPMGFGGLSSNERMGNFSSTGYREEEFCANYNDFGQHLERERAASKTSQGVSDATRHTEYLRDSRKDLLQNSFKNPLEDSFKNPLEDSFKNPLEDSFKDLLRNPMMGSEPDFEGMISSSSPVHRPVDALAQLEEVAAKTLHRLIQLLYQAKGMELGDGPYHYEDPLENSSGSSMNGGPRVSPVSSMAGGPRVSPVSSMAGGPIVSPVFSMAGGPIVSPVFTKVSQTQVTYSETESTTFQGQGMAITQDGRQIVFDVELSMSRTFAMEYSKTMMTQQTLDLMDPLVIQLSGNPEWVSNQTFFFDLDSDGTKEDVTALARGNAFLALDRNQDGIINDGSELFGTKSGNGFYDLSAYDLDGNGWIDEGDEVFSKLKVFSVDEDGKEVSLSLKEADVGAIYLGNVDTTFAEKNQFQETTAKLRSSGIFLRESGSVGIVGQLDLAKA